MSRPDLPALIKTGRRVGGLALWRWRLFTRPVYRLAASWSYRLAAIPAGYETDFVSAPFWARPLLPLRHMAGPALYHDFLRTHRLDLSCPKTDDEFEAAMEEFGTPNPARTIAWWAVQTNNNRA